MKKLLAIVCCIAAVCAVLASDLKVNISYQGSTNDTAGFVLYYGPSSQNYTNSINVGYMTSATISNLPPNTLLYLSSRAKAYNGLEGDLGNEIAVITPSDAQSLPSMVKDFRLVIQ